MSEPTEVFDERAFQENSFQVGVDDPAEHGDFQYRPSRHRKFKKRQH
jgi:hypothetical protein